MARGCSQVGLGEALLKQKLPNSELPPGVQRAREGRGTGAGGLQNNLCSGSVSTAIAQGPLPTPRSKFPLAALNSPHL